MIPAPFQTLRALRVLNIAAVGLSLAAAVAAVFSILFERDAHAAFSVGLPTCILGAVWAAILRSPKTVGKRKLRWGWLASVPLAATNGALAASLFAGLQWHGAANYALGAIVGATVGAIFWVPGLIATLALFGAPLAHAQRLAAKGLAGAERGERVVGLVCATMSCISLLLAVTPLGPPFKPLLATNLWVTATLAILGTVVGAVSSTLAFARESRRRRFVSEVDAGKIAGYRLDDTPEGKVLVRVVSQGAGYRVADFEEEVFELDPAGEATRPASFTSQGS